MFQPQRDISRSVNCYTLVQQYMARVGCTSKKLLFDQFLATVKFHTWNVVFLLKLYKKAHVCHDTPLMRCFVFSVEMCVSWMVAWLPPMCLNTISSSMVRTVLRMCDKHNYLRKHHEQDSRTVVSATVKTVFNSRQHAFSVVKNKTHITVRRWGSYTSDMIQQRTISVLCWTLFEIYLTHLIWESDNRPSSQGISHILRNTTVRHHNQQSPPLHNVLSQLNPVHTLPHLNKCWRAGTRVLWRKLQNK
jgi:hypothetical protein